MTTITLWGVEDRLVYTTYIVDDYKNASQWNYITRNATRGYLVKFPNGKLSKSLQINADCQPIIEDETADTFELKQVCQRIWDETSPNPKRKVKPTKDEVLAQVARMEQMVKDLFE